MPDISLTDYSSQLAANARQQRMAELLQQQSMEPIQIMTAGGAQVPIPFTAALAKVLQSGLGAYKASRAEKGAAKIKAAQGTEARDYIKGTRTGSQISLPGVTTPADLNRSAANLDTDPGLKYKIAAMLDRGNPAAQGGPAPQGTPAMPTPPMPTQLAMPAQTPMGGQPPMGGPPMPAQPTMSMFPQSGPRAPLIAPQLTRDITTEEQEARYEEAANSDNPRLAAWGQRHLDEIDTIKAEERKLITVGAGDQIGRIAGGKFTKLVSAPQVPKRKSAYDSFGNVIVSWEEPPEGGITDPTTTPIPEIGSQGNQPPTVMSPEDAQKHPDSRYLIRGDVNPPQLVTNPYYKGK
jgi:hypothetical protein